MSVLVEYFTKIITKQKITRSLSHGYALGSVERIRAAVSSVML